MSQHCADCSHSSDNEHGSFLTGLTLGMFAGAAGYFLFGTKRGETVRKAVEREWEGAKEELAREGVIESAEVGLGSMIRSVFESVAKEIGWEIDSEASKTKSKSKSKTAEPIKKNRKKFKGV